MDNKKTWKRKILLFQDNEPTGHCRLKRGPLQHVTFFCSDNVGFPGQDRAGFLFWIFYNKKGRIKMRPFLLPV